MPAAASLELADSALSSTRFCAPAIPPEVGGYRVGDLIGYGGMGEVYAARHTKSGRSAAIKILRPALVLDQAAVERFRREAALASSLRGPHSVRVFACGFINNGLPFMVMELLRGSDLEGVVERGPLPIPDAIRWTLEACQAVSEAHARGVIHRDLKPSNLFVANSPRGQVLKVLDYGIARAAKSAPRLTATRAAVGTPHFMSPEQAKNSKTIDHRTDVWSLGVILYQFLTGRLPFDGDSPTEIAIQVCTAEPARPSALRSGIPPELENIVLWAMAKDPANRPANVTELAIALRLATLPPDDCAPGSPPPVRRISARPAARRAAPLPARTTAPDVSPAPNVEWWRPHAMIASWVTILLAVAIVVALGVAASPAEGERPSEADRARASASLPGLAKPRIVLDGAAQYSAAPAIATSLSTGIAPPVRGAGEPPSFEESDP